MYKAQYEARSKSILADLEAAYQDMRAAKISVAKYNQVAAAADKQLDDLTTKYSATAKALSYSHAADSAEFNRANGTFHGAGGGKGTPVSKNLSPMQLDQNELWSMFQSAKRRMPYRAEITSFSDGGGVGFKTVGASIAEGAPYPSGLFPPVIRPELTQDLRYEYDRAADHIPTVTIEAPSVEYLVHTGNTNPAAVVEELGTKPDLGIQLDTRTAVPIKIAALASTSMEALQDFDYFASWVPRELTNALIDVETDQIVAGTGEGQMTGFIAIEGVLTRAYNGSTDISPIDTLLQAITDIRVGPAYGNADLILLHPAQWDGIRRTKTTTDAFVLNVMNPNEIGSLDNLFGTKVVTNTKVPYGTAIVLDTQQAAKYFVRQSLTIDMNMWGDVQWTTNAISWRAEMRSTLAVTRPTAVSIVTGLGFDGS